MTTKKLHYTFAALASTTTVVLAVTTVGMVNLFLESNPPVIAAQTDVTDNDSLEYQNTLESGKPASDCSNLTLEGSFTQEYRIAQEYQKHTLECQILTLDCRNQTLEYKNLTPECQSTPEEKVTPEYSDTPGEIQMEVTPEQVTQEKQETQTSQPRMIVMEVTAYTAGYESTQKKKGEVGYGITASGAYVKQGRTIAAGKNFEFGTRLYIPYFDGKPGFGDGTFTVEDRGGAIGNYNIDVYFDSLQQAREFGRQNLEVYLMEE